VVVGIQVMQTVSVVREPSVGEVAAYGEAYLVGGALALAGFATAWFVRSAERDEGGPEATLVDEPRSAIATP
jgi:hypothetical protein